MSFLNSVKKGIILSGGTASRLFPITLGNSKQLLHVYDKPMIYYPLCTLMLAGIRDILLITTPKHKELFEDTLGNGEHIGIKISYEIQPKPEGLAQAFILGEKFISNDPVALILGDNLYHGKELFQKIDQPNANNNGAIVFGYPVKNPEKYGVPELGSNGQIKSIEEKPLKPKSKYAITGLYFYDNTVSEKAKQLKPSKRGELEITDLNNMYIKEDSLYLKLMSRGMAWFDTGSFDSLFNASSYVKTIQERQGLIISSPEEIAWRAGWINDDKLLKSAQSFKHNSYGKNLLGLLEC